jgi:D-alanine-D-alanine ligase-like ATP-grasp enzyme
MSDEFPEYTEHVGACKDCGNSPVNHFFAKMMGTLDVLTGVIAKKYGESFVMRGLGEAAGYASSGIVRFTAVVLEKAGVLAYAHEPEQALSYRSRVIWEEAMRRNIDMEQMRVLGNLTDTYRARIDGTWVYFESIPIPPQYERISTQWIGDKVLLKRELAKKHIPVPRCASATTFVQAVAFLKKISGPVVVKPRVGTRGRHTSVSVRTVADMQKAFKSAKVLCRYVAIEEELEGSVCRATVVDGKLVGFFQADPPVVVGDGAAKLRELIEKANASREERVAQIELNEENIAYLKRLGYSLESVPTKGMKIPIGHRTGRLFGGKTKELLESVHPKLKEYAEKAARTLNTAIVGFDLMIKDPEVDPDTQRWGILEANTLPFIDLHYLPLYGKPSNPAAAVWDLWQTHQEYT